MSRRKAVALRVASLALSLSGGKAAHAVAVGKLRWGKCFHTHDELIERLTLIPETEALVRCLLGAAASHV